MRIVCLVGLVLTSPGDVEEGTVGNNSHPSDHGGNNMASKQEAREGSTGPSGDAPIKEEKSGHKDKSVLQAKLTKLAIQIGYAGKTIHFFFIDQIVLDLWDGLVFCVYLYGMVQVPPSLS